MSRNMRRFISFFLAMVLLVGTVPGAAFAAEPPVIQEASSEAPYIREFVADGTYIQEGVGQDGTAGNPMPQILEAYSGTNKMDTAYLTISVDKYGKTISATDTSSNEVEVLEYTQWQMSARYVRIYEGEVVEDKDVTKECTWTTSDVSGKILTVTDKGLVTAYGAAKGTYAVSANYLGTVNVPDTGLTEKHFTANMNFSVTQLQFLNDETEAMRSLALTKLLEYEWTNLKNYAGRTVSEWAAEMQNALLKSPSQAACSDEARVYLKKDNGGYTNSARMLHFISAAAGDCTIGQPVWTGESDMVLTCTFSKGAQKYLVFEYGAGNVDVTKGASFASKEDNGKRNTELMADIHYQFVKNDFQTGVDVYNSVHQSGDNIKVVGEYFGGTIAKYVSYMTGCQAQTFNAPSPIQYVFYNNLPEFCDHYSIDNQKNYVFWEYYRKSPMYSIEPTYCGSREYESTLEYLLDNGDYLITIGSVPQNRNKEQTLWRRRIYLGDDTSDIYEDTGAFTAKINTSAMFGGGGADALTAKSALKNVVDGGFNVWSVLQYLSFAGVALKSGWLALISSEFLDCIADVPAFAWDKLTVGGFNSNILSGGDGNDTIWGAWWDNSFCYASGSGNDVFYTKGVGNTIYLMGYGDQKATVSHTTSEDRTMLFVTVNNSDHFTIDITDFFAGDIRFYQGSPFDEDLEVIYRIKPLSERQGMKYWKYSCPVDVFVLDASGNIVQELKDGQEYSALTDYGVFDVSLEDGEYVKTVAFLKEGYTVQARGVGNGTMEFIRADFSFEGEDGQYCSIENVPVTKGAVYYPSDDLEVSLMTVDTDGDGTVDDTITYDTTISFDQDTYAVPYGTRQQLEPDISTSSTDRECLWISSNEEVVTVDDDGMLTAVGFGEAEIYAMMADGSGAYASCKVTVPQEELDAGDFTVTGLESAYEYTGEPIDVQLEVSYGCFPLLQDVHYTAAFSELVEPGKATLIINGINDYSGTMILDYEILAPEVPDTVEEKVDWIAAECRKAGISGQWETALWLHDWLVYNANYDYTYTYYHPEGVLLNGTGVCQSYAEAYALLLDEFSIENTVLVAPKMDHAWNLVKIDGEWCHIDCTWDDPGTGGAENHTFFGMNDALMQRDHVWNTAAYTASTSKKNYYLIRTNANVVESTKELEEFLARMAESKTETFECYYIGENSDFSIFEAFQVWCNTYDWKYGLAGYSLEGTRWMLRATVYYGDPWEPPANITDIVDCPDFTLRGPDGVYPLTKFAHNGMVLIFGRETCGNTQALMYELHPQVKALKEQGIQVFVSLNGIDVASGFDSVRQEYPDFTYTYYDMFLLDQLLGLFEISGNITYPAVFVINGNGKIISCTTGYVEDVDGLMERILQTATDHPLPDPDPVDNNYYGSLFNYTGDQTALEKFIAEQLAAGKTQIAVRDGTWVDDGTEWDSYVLGEAMMDALAPYRSDPRYKIPYGWSYYYYYHWVVIEIEYPEHVEHIPQTVPGKAPTCTESGWTDGSVCSVCGITLTAQEMIPATGHTPKESTDCSAPVTCAVCDQELKAVLGHDYISIVVEPDCTNDGYTRYTCSRCADSYQDQPVPALGHRYGDWRVKEAPTCTLDGKQYRVCAVCGAEEEATIAATGHTPGEPERENEKEATCLKDGRYELVVFCEECEEELSRETVTVTAAGHSYDAVTVEQTCTQRGYTVYTCHCGASYVGDFTEAAGHKKTLLAGKPATCTQPGLTEGLVCENCGEIFSAQETVAALGHSWSDPEVLAAATAYSDGVQVSVCQICAEEKTEILPAMAHIHVYSASVTEASCGEPGYTTYLCSCGAAYTDDYTEAHGHTAVEIPAVAATCSAAGLTAGSYCSVCQTVLAEQKETPALAHTWDEGVVTEEATEEAQGKMLFTCQVCGFTQEKTVPVLGHVHDYRETVIAPTCTEQGYTLRQCDCGDEFADDYTAALGHTEAADTAVAPTCTESGLTAGSSCSVCGEVLETGAPVAPLSHDWDTGEQTAVPGAFSAGLMTYSCRRCGETRTEILPALEHVHRYTPEVTAPGCGQQGYTRYLCSCGAEYLDEFADALEHTYTEQKVIAEAGCTAAGEEQWICEACGHVETVVIPATGHLFAESDGQTVCNSCSVALDLVILEEYITLPMGKTSRMNLVVSPAELSSGIIWRTDDDSVVEVDETGLVKAVGVGTAYVTATVDNGDTTLSARCRVDVAEPFRVDGIQLGETEVTAELFSRDYEIFEILLQLPQNTPAATKQSPQNRDTGVTLEEAWFTVPEMAELFGLQILDDRRVRVIPTEKALAEPESLKKIYCSTVSVKLAEVEEPVESTQELELTVKQTRPKLTAKTGTFNSFYTKQAVEITVTGGTVVAGGISLNEDKTTPIPDWLTLENGILRLTEDAPAKKVSGKVYLLVETEEWEIPAQVTLSVQNVYKKPGLKLSASSVTVTEAALLSGGTKLKLNCTAKGDTLLKLNVAGIAAPSGYEISDFDPATGSFLLKAEEGFVGGTIYLRVRFHGTERTLDLPLKVVTRTPVLKLAKTSVTLNTRLEDAVTIAVTVTPRDHVITNPTIRLTDTSKQKNDKTESGELLVQWDEDAQAIRIRTTSLTPEEAAYKLYIKADGSKEVSATVKVMNAKPTVSFKATGSLDLSFPGQAVTIVPSFKNYTGGTYKLLNWTVTEKKGKQILNTDAKNLFALEEEKLVLTWKEGIQTGNTYEIALELKLPGVSDPVAGKVSLTAKRTAVKLKPEKTSISLNKTLDDAADVAVTCTTRGYAFTAPLMELQDSKGKVIEAYGESLLDNDKLHVTWKNGKIHMELGTNAEYGQKYRICLKADSYSPVAVLKVSVPSAGKSKVTVSLKAKGSVDVIRQGSAITLTPSYKNCMAGQNWQEELLVYTSQDKYTVPVEGLFHIAREDGQLVLTQAGSLNPSLKYKVQLVSRLDDLEVKSGKISISVKMGSAKLTMASSGTTLFAKDKNDRAELLFAAKDGTLNQVQNVVIKDSKYKKLFEIHSYGNNAFAVGYKAGKVDSSIVGKTVTLNLNIFLEGNVTAKPNATLKLKVKVLN